MRLFGFEIRRARNVAQDKVLINAVEPSRPVSEIPPIKPTVLKYAQSYAGGRGTFSAPEYDLIEIGVIEDTDSFVSQAFKKKMGLMFKEGVGYSGPNKETLEYIKVRMAQIARATGTPSLALLKSVAHSLIRTSNAFLIKVRDPKASGGRVRTDANGKQYKPIAGYFTAAPETMFPDLDKDSGKIRSWRQQLPDGRYKDFATDNVLHFTLYKREGFLFGIPTLVPVIDDIRALRQIEENIEMLLYQHLFPLFQYKVGTETHPAGMTERGTREVDEVKQQLRIMPLEGGIVTPERHEITAVGAEGRAIRAEGYLDHFKKRVFAGLGVSQVDMGDGDTTNRATAQTMSRALVDTVKEIQDCLEVQWDQLVVAELLLESTFGKSVLEEKNLVHLKFKEIDIQNKMELEKHAAEMFEANAITWDELRAEFGKDPIQVPEDPHDQDPTKYPEWHNTYWKLFDEPGKLIVAADEPYSLAAQQAAESRSTALTGEQVSKAQSEKDKSTAVEAEEDRKTKIAVMKARPAPKVAKKDHYLASAFSQFEQETTERVLRGFEERQVFTTDLLLSHARTWAAHTSNKLISQASAELIKGFNDQTGVRAGEAIEILSNARKVVADRISRVVERLATQTIQLIRRRIDAGAAGVKLQEVQRFLTAETHIAFDATKYRADFIYDVEIRKAYNFGRIIGLRFTEETTVVIEAERDACDRCKAAASRIMDVAYLDIGSVVPLHPGCKCTMKVIKTKK